MLDLIIVNFLKIINNYINSKNLNIIINRFYKNKATQTLKKLEVASIKNFPAKKIRKILQSSGININIEEDEFFTKLIDLFFGDNKSSNTRDFIRYKLKAYCFKTSDVFMWLKFRNLFYIKLELELGSICRKNAVNVASKKNFYFKFYKKMQARARLEQALTEEDPARYFKNFPIKFQFKRKIIQNFLSNVLNMNLNEEQSSIKNNEKELFNMINNKKVAIVGPIEADHKSANEIDSFDVVVRLNYSFSGKDLDPHGKGLKIDLSYFNGEQIDYIININKCKLPDELKAVCIKDNSSNRTEKIKRINFDKIVKKIKNYNDLNFYNTFHLLPIALLDILENDPKIVKIFHSDLFLTTKRTLNYYPKSFNRDHSKVFKMFRESIFDHDPSCHHEFLRNLFIKGKIIGDEKFNHVMHLETSEYLKKLQKYYL